MKKLITFVIALTLFSCAKEEKPEYTIISGKMTHNEENKFTIRGIAFEKEITLDQNGNFTDTLHIDYNGAYRIGRNELYLHSGKNLNFEVDAQNWSSIVFTGDLAAENNYISKKTSLEKETISNDPKAFYLVGEAEFLSKLNSFNQKRKELLEQSTFTVENFKEKELRSIDYHTNYLLNIYIEYQKRFGENKDFTVSENFPDTNTITDFEDSEEFNFSTSYRSLVNDNFYKKVEEAMGDEETPEKYYEALFTTFKTVKAQNIKNSLSRVVAQAVSASNDNSEEIYNYLINNTTDEIFKTELTEKFNKIKTLVKGNPSPKFNYENHNGGTTSLDDLKGKFVYIDVWATWCGPCKREIPHLKEIEKQYHDKNIAIVSISIDEKKDYEKWREFVKTEELGGIQLYADNAWQSQFVSDYAIEGIPRFILVDTEGNIISADAPRPSDPKLIELFTEIGL